MAVNAAGGAHIEECTSCNSLLFRGNRIHHDNVMGLMYYLIAMIRQFETNTVRSPTVCPREVREMLPTAVLMVWPTT